MVSRLALGLLALLLASCVTSIELKRTQVMLIVDAETEVQARTRRVRVSVVNEEQAETVVELPRAGGTLAWPVRVALVPRNQDSRRTYTVEARALEAGGGVVSIARLRSGYVDGRTLVLSLVLTDACVDHPGCPANQTCVNGACAPIAFTPPETLPELDAGPQSDAHRLDARTDGGDAARAELDADGAVDPDAFLEDDANLADATVLGDANGLDAFAEAAVPVADSGLDGGSDPVPDAALPDAFGIDTGTVDGGDRDAGHDDAGLDAASRDAGVDAAPADAGVDAAPVDAGLDAGSRDAGLDAHAPDAGRDAFRAPDAGGDTDVQVIGATSVTFDVGTGATMRPTIEVRGIPSGTLIPTTWSVDRPDVATINASGVLAPTGTAFGTVTLSAVALGRPITHVVTVRAEGISMVGAPPGGAVQSLLANAMGPDTTTLAYPYDGTRLPQGLSSIDVITVGAAGTNDYWMVELSAPAITLRQFVRGTAAPLESRIDPTHWIAIQGGMRPETITLRVARYDSAMGRAQVTGTARLTFVSGTLPGGIWSYADERSRPLRFVPQRPTRLDDPLVSAGQGLLAYQRISADGTRLHVRRAATDQVSLVYTLTSSSAMLTTTLPAYWSELPAFDRAGTIIVGDGEARRLDTNTILAMTGLSWLATQPTIAADDRTIAGLGGAGDVQVAIWNNATRSSGLPAILAPAASHLSLTISPDGRWVLYVRGSADRGTVFAKRVTTSDPEVRLRGYDRDTADPREEGVAFCPQLVGGLLWVAADSSRALGSSMPAGTSRIWIFAFDPNAGPLADPSFPPFRLPDQGVSQRRGVAWGLLPP